MSTSHILRDTKLRNSFEIKIVHNLSNNLIVLPSLYDLYAYAYCIVLTLRFVKDNGMSSTSQDLP